MKQSLLLTISLLGASPCAWASDNIASPFGVEIGKTNCELALQIVRGEYERKELNRLGLTVIRVSNAGILYQGATKAVLACAAKDKPVQFLRLIIGVGDETEALKRAAAELKQRYTLQFDSLANGRGMMTFAAGTTTIDLTASGVETFTIDYMSPEMLARKRASESSEMTPSGRL